MGVSIILFYAEVRDNIGLGVLNNFLIGTYHKPIEEDRIFMFLDMKDSTTIADQMGHSKYFGMLKEYYSDLTDPIIASGGEIYQYVGDEVVVTWKQGKNTSDNRCINCFFDMKSALHRQASKYQSQYGLVPTFKAGIHVGRVTTGEIGVIKKEIVFSGDVLNTAARIQSLCNKYSTDLLVSEQLIDIVNGNDYDTESIGEVGLKGRNEKVNLFTITKT